MTLLSVSGLSVDIHQTAILRDVGFEMEAGSVFGLVGESGSGKSMTALALMGLLPRGAVAKGRADLEGKDLLALSERQLQNLRGNEIGMIFQEPMTALNPLQMIGDQVAETLLIHGEAGRAAARVRSRDVLDRVGLDGFSLERYPHELSGGQRQRVSIAMAIALRPRLLIADEPTTALDVTTQAGILRLLRDLVADDGMALLLITHDLAVVADMADRVGVMQEGRIVEAGVTEAVFRGRAHPYTQALFAASTYARAREPVAQGAPLLSVENAVRSYPGARSSPFAARSRVRAVDGVSFVLRRGESLGLVGESGCGKSTLSRAILGLDGLDAGEIRLGGEPVVAPHVPADLRRRMQVVFQDPYGSFDPRHRVARLITEPFHLTGAADPDMIDQVLSDVGLKTEDKHKYIHEFSGGQRQRIAIARALVTRPELIVLDEAVSALDVGVRAQVLDLLSDLQARYGLSYLFISHDLTVVRAVTDRVLVMQKGRIVEEGTTSAVLSSPGEAYTQSLLHAVPQIPKNWQV